MGLVGRAIASSLASTALLACAAAALAQASTATTIWNLPAQPLGDALIAVGRQTDTNILAAPALVKGRTAPALQGSLTRDEALSRLLVGTGLTPRVLDEHTVTLAPRSPNTSSALFPGAGATPLSAGEGDSVHLAQADQATARTDSPLEKEQTDQTSQRESVRLEEVVVTAEKREERLQDVPVPVTVLNAVKLAESGQVLLRDFYATVPGLSIAPGIQGSQVLSIRGINEGFGNPTVGISVDDVPFGASTKWGGEVVPDIDPSDLAHIEVLRGPQGTLYGANSMGGLIKYVTANPSTEGYTGRIEAGTNAVYNGSQVGYSMRASANVPLTETLAVRISGFTREDPGYIDNPFLDRQGINETNAHGGHLSALWQISDAASLRLGALYQSLASDAVSEVDVAPNLGPWQQNYVAGAGAYDRTVQVYSATFKAAMAGVDLTSITGYNVNHDHDALDFSSALQPAAEMNYGVGGALVLTDQTAYKLTEELRLASKIGDRLDWLVGGFYTHETDDYTQSIPAVDEHTGQQVGQFDVTTYPNTYKEYAGFITLTWHVLPRFNVQIGGRDGEIEQTYTSTDISNNYPFPTPHSGTVVVPLLSIKHNAVTYLLTPQWKITDDLMLYARVASGYRPGGPNLPEPGIPAQSAPDKTQNYEIGFKGDFLDRVLSVDASLYYIKWTNIQLGLQDTQTLSGYSGNAGEAKSAGVELSFNWRPLAGMTVSAWGDYDDAVLTQGFPANSSTYGVPGDRLPYTSKFSGHVAFEQAFKLGNDFSAFGGGELSYVGDRLGIFTPSTARQDLPAYTTASLRAGVRRDSWSVTGYVNNVANRRGLLDGGTDYFPVNGFVYIQPRTVGVSVAKTFDAR